MLRVSVVHHAFAPLADEITWPNASSAPSAKHTVHDSQGQDDRAVDPWGTYVARRRATHNPSVAASPGTPTSGACGHSRSVSLLDMP